MREWLQRRPGHAGRLRRDRLGQLRHMMRTRIPVLLLVLTLAACEPHQPEEVPPPPVAPETPAPDATAPTPAPTPADPTTAPAAPAQPAPNAPSPTDPSAQPKPTAALAPAVTSMALA